MYWRDLLPLEWKIGQTHREYEPISWSECGVYVPVVLGAFDSA